MSASLWSEEDSNILRNAVRWELGYAGIEQGRFDDETIMAMIEATGWKPRPMTYQDVKDVCAQVVKMQSAGTHP